jgi:hypothetical protein
MHCSSYTLFNNLSLAARPLEVKSCVLCFPHITCPLGTTAQSSFHYLLVPEHCGALEQLLFLKKKGALCLYRV